MKGCDPRPKRDASNDYLFQERKTIFYETARSSANRVPCISLGAPLPLEQEKLSVAPATIRTLGVARKKSSRIDRFVIPRANEPIEYQLLWLPNRLHDCVSIDRVYQTSLTVD